MIERLFAPYAKGRGPVFSVQLWDTMQATDHYPVVGNARFGYRLSMDGQLVVEGEDFICPPNVAAESNGILDTLIDYLTDEGYLRQMADGIARRATTVEERDQYLLMLAYLPHCEALRREATTLLSTGVMR